MGDQRSVRRGGQSHVHEVSLRAAVSGRRRDAHEDSNRRLEYQPRLLQRLRRRRHARRAAAGDDSVSRRRNAPAWAARASAPRASSRTCRRTIARGWKRSSCDLKRRINGAADIIILDGAERMPRYSSAEMHKFAYKPALSRQSGRVSRNCVIMPMSKTAAWWEKSALERHSYFYPHHEDSSGSPVKGHAKAAEAGISKVFRRLYHNPDGYQRPERVRLHHLLRVHRREHAGVRSDLPRAAR